MRLTQEEKKYERSMCYFVIVCKYILLGIQSQAQGMTTSTAIVFGRLKDEFYKISFFVRNLRVSCCISKQHNIKRFYVIYTRAGLYYESFYSLLSQHSQ